MPSSLAYFFHAPGMYVHNPDFDSVTAFLTGFDTAFDGRIMNGFREWLILKVDDGNNLAWTELFLKFAFPDSIGPQTHVLRTTDQKQLIQLLAKTFTAFWSERERNGGFQELMERHSEWLKKQEWYRESK